MMISHEHVLGMSDTELEANHICGAIEHLTSGVTTGTCRRIGSKYVVHALCKRKMLPKEIDYLTGVFAGAKYEYNRKV